MRYYLSILFLTTQFIQVYASSVITHNLIFQRDQVKLNLEQKEKIYSLTGQMYQGQRLILYPVTIDDGSSTYLFSKMAQEQAQETAEYMISIGFQLIGTPRNFPSQYKGYSVGVDVKLQTSPYHQQGEAPFGLEANYPEKKAQFFLVNPLRDTTIYGEEGTEIRIPALALTSRYPVQVKLKEYYALADLMINDMSTISNGSMIETGGSIFLDAREAKSKRKVSVNKNIGLSLGFANGKHRDTAMQIFVKDSRAKKMNWVLPPKKPSVEIVKTWSMTKLTLDAEGNVLDSQRFNSKAEWLAHLKIEEEKVKKKKEDQKKKQENQDKLKIYNLGHINCDRFPEEPKIQFAVQGDQEILAEYFVVFNDVKGVLKGNENSGRVTFGKVPKNTKAKLIAVSFQGDQAFYYSKNIIPKSAMNTIVSLDKVDRSVVDRALAGL